MHFLTVWSIFFYPISYYTRLKREAYFREFTWDFPEYEILAIHFHNYKNLNFFYMAKKKKNVKIIKMLTWVFPLQ